MHTRVLLLTCLLSASTVFAQGVVNGSLTGPVGEAVLPSSWSGFSSDTWQPGGVVFSYGVYASGIPASPDGGTFVSSVGVGTYQEWFSQNVSGLVPGESYVVTFHAANAGFLNTGGPYATETGAGSIQVTLGGETQETPIITHDGFGSQTWHTYSMTFTPSFSTLDLTFTARDRIAEGGGAHRARMAVDGVQLTAQTVGNEARAFGELKRLFR
ncbi:MAG TPA: hypothetical protein P5571_14215 [Candidatus Krumholzibacteria bacterium]|nr:hypothetical protein [Candidatus Krumholzibacteria bacterium]HRX52522.1 hypothetical protein [Candidatus Krumholzibacteria bacterium]